jgi:hypothetical protein
MKTDEQGSLVFAGHEQPWRRNIRSFVCGLLFLLGADSAVPALELKPPRLVVSDVQLIDIWCGEHRIVYLKNDSLVWRDFLSDEQLALSRKGDFTRVRGCSADGRWLLTENGGYHPEAHDPDCRPFWQEPLPRVMLWDSREKKGYTIGQGHFHLEWGPRGALLLHSLHPACDLERDRRAWFSLPPEFRDVQTIDVRGLLGRALLPKSGWDGKRVGITRWLDANRFIAELANDDGDFITDSLAGGALVAVTLDSNALVDVRQLNPMGFVRSWSLPIPQAVSGDSDAMLKAAGCQIERDLNMMSCNDFRRVPGLQSEEIDSQLLRHFCEGGLKSEDVCGPDAGSLNRWRRGPYALLLRAFSRPGDAGLNTEIFLIEINAGEKSK